MLRLRTLGGLSIEQIDGPSLSGVATSARRRLALLAVLAGGTRPIPRDKLLALFWPESDTDRARHALDQSLYALKRELKAPDLFVGREELTLNPTAITSDIADLRAALTDGRNAAAVELYAGPFLDGVFVSGAPDVERWIDEQRTRIAHDVESALEALANDAAARDDHRTAAQWWRKLAAMDPRKTRVIVSLMSELAASGDRAGALRQAEMYSTLVRDDLDADPNPAVIAFAEQLRREPQTPTTSVEQIAPAHSSSSASSTTSADAEHPLAGRYIIERVIGRGGASTVFLARDLRNERRVALKVLRRELGGGIVAERFRYEIAVTANLQHPHILPVHEWGEAEGTLYFAMPFIEGESLRERMNREHRLPVEDVARLAREVAGALGYAHERGIVHRDVKPENILLTSGHALVADFGIARVSEGAIVGAPRRTDPGIILGTPAYLSPEQASGEFEIDARSDQYSLACVLYEMLVGAPPFTAKDPITLLTQRLDSAAPSVHSRRPEVPDQIDRAIARALSINPAHRFDNIASFAAALAMPATTVSAEIPVPSVAPAASSRQSWRSGPTLTRAVIGAAALGVALAFTIAWRMNKRPLAERGWVVLADVENQTRDTIFNRALDAALLTGLQQSTYVNVLPRSRVDQVLARMRRADTTRPAARTLDERTAREVAEREGIRAVAIATVDQIDSSYFVSVRVVDAKTGVALATERQQAKGRAAIIPAIDDVVRRLRANIGESAEAIAKHDRPLPLATTQSLEALRNYADGLAAFRAAQREAGIQLLERAVSLDSDFALAHAELGAVYYVGNDRPSGDLHYNRALALLGRLTQREQLLIRASAESYRGNREQAIELYRMMLAEYPDDANAWAQIGYNYLRLNRDELAIDAFKRQLALDSNSSTGLINLATSYKGAARFDDARTAYAHAFAVEPALLRVANLNHEYGGSLILGGHLNEARAVYDTMVHGTADQRAQGERSLGLLSMYLGQFAEARLHFHQATVATQAAGKGRELTEARNRLFTVAAERELGGPWRDSIRAELGTAMTLFHRAYLEPTFLMYLGKALAREGEVAQAREVLDSLTRRTKPGNLKDRANQQTLAAEVALASGHADSAVALLRLAYVADETPFVSESLARALAQSGDRRAAIQQYEDLAQRPNRWYGWEAEPLGLSAWLEAGRLYEQLGDTLAARKAYQRHLGQWTSADSGSVSLRGSSRVK
ncbi:MAG TPA: protein kinase [Gemmatimonadaceae bacterium]